MEKVIDFIIKNPVCDILLVLGVLAIVLSYIIAPRASRKSGHYVSGIPLTGGFLIALGFLTSSVKWLALIGLLEPIILFTVYYIIDHKKKR